MLHTMLHVTPPSLRLTLTPVTLVTYGSCETVPGLQAEEDQAVAGYNLSLRAPHQILPVTRIVHPPPLARCPVSVTRPYMRYNPVLQITAVTEDTT